MDERFSIFLVSDITNRHTQGHTSAKVQDGAVNVDESKDGRVFKSKVTAAW